MDGIAYRKPLAMTRKARSVLSPAPDGSVRSARREAIGMNEASVSGFLRALLTFLVVWWIVRFLVKLYIVSRAARNARNTFQQAAPDPRVKGEVRIEKLDKDDPRYTARGTIEDADYEEVK